MQNEPIPYNPAEWDGTEFTATPNFVMTSVDGITWTKVKRLESGKTISRQRPLDLYSTVEYANGMFTAVPNFVMKSKDGIHWKKVLMPE
jgi:hypothetical protein